MKSVVRAVVMGLALLSWGCGEGDTPPSTFDPDVGGSGGDGGGGGPVETACMDGEDDDGDGLIDCSDPDCVGVTCSDTRTAWCVNLQCAGGEGTLECGDGLDNDLDGVADCEDPDCANSCACGECEEVCGDSRDNDEDGAIDEGCPCTYRNLDRGVCVDGSRQPDASCAAPPSYQPSELLCDGLDNDCDGVIDEGCTCRYEDRPNGVCLVTTINVQGMCREPIGYQRTEISCDGFDNDCDGNTDEGCAICDYQGTDVGVCQYGVPGTTAQECTPPLAHQPDERACDNLDNDCDGLVDEACPCSFRGLTAGVCARALLDGTGECVEPIGFEQAEASCDGFDNDCDGVVDEGCEACRFDGKANGVCVYGIPGASADECSAPSAYQADEGVCDGLDNDCDGVVDEGCPCLFGDMDRGVCTTATIDPTYGTCGVPEFYATRENGQCDGLDNNCDGVVDEGCSCDFKGIADGICAIATRDPLSGACAQPPGYVSDEITGTINGGPLCGGGVDNDCDGVVDEGCLCHYKDLATGVCKNAGDRQESGECPRPADFSDSEVCGDGLDNDCDGITDEGCAVCSYLNRSEGVCLSGIPGGMSGCQEPAMFEGVETSCDGLDNDCDGVTDEGCACNFNGNLAGVCASSVRDSSGVCQTPLDYVSDEGVAGAGCSDGVDSDCDGVVDEGCPCDFLGKPDGVCASFNDANGSCTFPLNFEAPFEVSCNDNLDNDCDGDPDGADPECSGVALESCENGVDDDGNQLIDCDDPACVGAPSCGHVVFITGAQVDGRLNAATDGHLGDADARCQQEANDAGIQGTFKAILSGDGIDARDRIVFRGNVFNNDTGGVGRSVVFSSGEFFLNDDDAINEAFGFDQNGISVSAPYWTGSTGSGEEDQDCQGWTSLSGADSANTGLDQGVASSTLGPHISISPRGCDQEHRLLCISGQDPEICGNGMDDDRDGYDDLSDPDCMPTMTTAENCENGTDDDGDGHIDCSDDDCTFGACNHTVFVTSAQQSAGFDTATKVWADDVCQDAANLESLGGVWRAVFSTSTVPAKERIFIRGKIFNNNGSLPALVMSGSDFFSGTGFPGDTLAYDEFGVLFPSAVSVWTGSTTTGGSMSNANCEDWTNASGGKNGAYGLVSPAMTSPGEYLFSSIEACNETSFSFLCINGQRPESCNRPGSQDGDLRDDSLDPDCEMLTANEICDNGEDDDQDGFTDLDDSECATGAVTMFTTAEAFEGDLGGVGGADAYCEESARQVGRRGSFRAVISGENTDTGSPVDARTRVSIADEVYNTDRTGVDLCFDHDTSDKRFYIPAVGTPHFPDGSVGYDAEGDAVDSEQVWSGSGPNGYANTSNTCSDWLDGTSNAVGNVGLSDDDQPPLGGENLAHEIMPGNSSVSCDQRRRLVCVGGQPRETLCGDGMDDDNDGVTDCDDPDCAASPECSLTLFVTKMSYSGGHFGDLASVDDECNSIAQNEFGQGGVAIAGDDFSSFASRLQAIIGDRGRWRSVRSADSGNGNPIAFYSLEDMFKGEHPEYPLGFDQLGDPIPQGASVWTGLEATLSSAVDSCAGWSIGGPMADGVVGNLDANDSGWISDGMLGCNESAHFYCLVVP